MSKFGKFMRITDTVAWCIVLGITLSNVVMGRSPLSIQESIVLFCAGWLIGRRRP